MEMHNASSVPGEAATALAARSPSSGSDQQLLEGRLTFGHVCITESLRNKPQKQVNFTVFSENSISILSKRHWAHSPSPAIKPTALSPKQIPTEPNLLLSNARCLRKVVSFVY